MLTAGLVSLAALLFVLLYLSLRLILILIDGSRSRKRRLQPKRHVEQHERVTGPLWGAVYAHVEDLLTSAGWRMNSNSFAGLTFTMGMTGILVGLFLFQSSRSALLLFGVLGSLPYSMLRMSLISRQLAARLHFLPAMELFYQCYLVSGSRHVRTALQKMVEERQLPGDIQAIFEQLYRQLCVQGDDERALRRFALSIGHVWAEYFSSMIKVALSEGNNIADNLKELIDDMRKARMDDQSERHRLLEIRLANFSPVLFLLLFLSINFRLNPEASSLYYLTDAKGRGMLLHAFVLMFASFLMGIYLSRRKM